MDRELQEAIAAIPWGEKDREAEGQLLALFSGDEETARNASYDLWVTLCNQGQTIPAALPVYDILLYGLRTLEPELQEELLDILYQFAASTAVIGPSESWKKPLREKFQRDRAVFQRFAADENEDLAAFAQLILEQI